MNKKTTCMRVIPISVFVTVHRISRSLKGFYKGSKLIWVSLILCVPYATADEKQNEV